MVAISLHRATAPNPEWNGQVRIFFKVYWAATIALPFEAGFFSPALALVLGLIGLALWEVEGALLVFFVRQGRDDTVACRWLGWTILARFVVSVVEMLITSRQS